jgi:hypothetical protein
MAQHQTHQGHSQGTDGKVQANFGRHVTPDVMGGDEVAKTMMGHTIRPCFVTTTSKSCNSVDVDDQQNCRMVRSPVVPHTLPLS